MLTILYFNYPTWAQSKFGIYGHTTVGTSRSIGLGGAIASDSRGSDVFFINPASTAHDQKTFSFEASQQNVTDNELNTNSTQTIDRLPSSLPFYTVNYKTTQFDFGLGYNQSYFASLNELITNYSAQLKSNEIILHSSYTINKSFCLGINYKWLQVDRDSNNYSEAEPSKMLGSRIQFGVNFKLSKWTFGAAKQTEFLGSETTQTINSVKYSSIPANLLLGANYEIKKERLYLFFDIHQWDRTPSLVAFESSIVSNYVSILEKTFNVLRTGLEFYLINSRKSNATFRIGFYDEPSKFGLNPNRQHISLGFEVRLGPALLQVSHDQASQFNNSSQSLTFIVDQL